MQSVTQVNQVLREFSRYGMLLYILAAIFFYQTLFVILMYMAIRFQLTLYTTYYLIETISDRIVTTAILIVLFILMLKAIKIHSKVHEPATKIFTTFSVLWFTFYIIGQIVIWLSFILSISTPISENYNLYYSFHYILYAAGILSAISQLVVWISLRKFLLDRTDIFPLKITKSIINNLIYLMITLGMISFIQALSINTLIIYNPMTILSMDYQLFVSIPTGILLIIGYSLLSFRLGKLKTSIDTSIP